MSDLADFADCAYCGARPLISCGVKPLYFGKSGPFARITAECPNGHMKSRGMSIGQVERRWNKLARAYIRNLEKYERIAAEEA